MEAKPQQKLRERKEQFLAPLRDFVLTEGFLDKCLMEILCQPMHPRRGYQDKPEQARAKELDARTDLFSHLNTTRFLPKELLDV